MIGPGCFCLWATVYGVVSEFLFWGGRTISCFQMKAKVILINVFDQWASVKFHQGDFPFDVGLVYDAIILSSVTITTIWVEESRLHDLILLEHNQSDANLMIPLRRCQKRIGLLSHPHPHTF